MFLKPSQLLVFIYLATCLGEDYYELLGIDKSANDREIRKAFKKLAVKMHPDKNKDDPDAHENFVRLAKAYEVLKDQESRKKYDLYGEEGFKSSNYQNYHSWSYYQNNFGIYDDDLEIVTLNKGDFEQIVLNSDILWFINFYSPMCSHCHHLAPSWRQLSKELEGVIRFGAVNCEEEWALCRQEEIHSYPSLLMYPMKEKYSGDRSPYEMKRFVLKRLQVEVVKICADMWPSLTHDKIYHGLPWLLFLLHDADSDHGIEERLKVAAILDGLVVVGVVDCVSDPKFCHEISHGVLTSIIFWEDVNSVHPIMPSEKEAKHIATKVLEYLPDAVELNEDKFEDIISTLQLKQESQFWLVYFYMSQVDETDLDLKKLPALLPDMRIGRIHCGRNANVCFKLHISRYPLFALFKPGGGYEIHHGKEGAHDVANFVRQSRSAPNMRVLSPDEFLEKTQGSSTGTWFIDFFAPWCPPCLRLLPELRKASQNLGDNVFFGTIDCTIHSTFCRQQDIRSYPTTTLYNGSHSAHPFLGRHTASDLVDFVNDILQPVVIKLTEENFYNLIGNKGPEDMWLIDYYAPWCGPCQQLAPQWRKLAKLVSDLQNVHVGEVNCETDSSLCSQQGVRSYPTVRLYPLGGKGLSTFAMYSGFHRDARSLRQWLHNFLPSTVEMLTPDTFSVKVIHGTEPWLVDFYAPWCGHCVAFAPEFEVVSQKLDGLIKCGKVDCNVHKQLCMQQGVSAYPTVMFYHDSSQEEISSQQAEDIVNLIRHKLSEMKTSHLHDEF